MALVAIHGHSQALVGTTGQIYGDVTLPSGGSIAIADSGRVTGEKAVKVTTGTGTGSRGDIGFLAGWLPAGGRLVGRVYIYIEEMPSGYTDPPVIIDVGHGSYAHFYLLSDGSLDLGIGGGTIQNGPTLSINTWYRLDFDFNSTANPWTCDWQVDGSAQTQATLATAANTTQLEVYPEVWMPSSDVNGGIAVRFASWAFDTDGADYPIGAGKVLGYRPTGDGTHNAPESFEITDNSFSSNTALESTSTAYQRLDDDPWSASATDYLRQSVGTTADYAAFTMADSAEAAGRGIAAVYCMAFVRGATTSSCNLGGRVFANSAEGTFFAATAITTTGRITHKGILTARPGTGAWTVADFNGAVARFGYASDVNPDPWLDAFVLEVAYTGEESTTYDKAGTVTAGLVASAQDAAEHSETGTITTAASASAADVADHAEAGSVTIGAVLSGADVHEANETGAVASRPVLSGADVAEHAETGTLTTAPALSGTDAAEHDESGTITSTVALSGADVAEHEETGTVTTTATVSGEAAISGGVTYDKAGTVTAGLAVSGQDAAEHNETGTITTGLAASGTDSADHAESGTVTAGASVSATDAADHSETGTVTTGARLAGADAAEHNETGTASTGAIVSGADAAEHNETGSASTGMVLSGADAVEYIEAGLASLGAYLSGVSDHEAEHVPVDYDKAGSITLAGALSGSADFYDFLTYDGAPGWSYAGTAPGTAGYGAATDWSYAGTADRTATYAGGGGWSYGGRS